MPVSRLAGGRGIHHSSVKLVRRVGTESSADAGSEWLREPEDGQSEQYITQRKRPESNGSRHVKRMLRLHAVAICQATVVIHASMEDSMILEQSQTMLKQTERSDGHARFAEASSCDPVASATLTASRHIFEMPALARTSALTALTSLRGFQMAPHHSLALTACS